MSIIKVKNISKTYYSEELETPVLFNLNFEIEQGEFVAIMGPSGSGKSTLLHILGFLDDQTSGVYYFNGKKINDYTGSEIAQIRNKEMGFVFQAFNLLPRTTVYDNVRLPLIYSDTPEKNWDELIINAIKDVGLEHRIYHETSQLSGGEKQRVAIARALVTNPNVIFADEPTGNLDSKSGKNIIEILQKLNKEKNHTIVLITHESETAHCAKRIIHIIDGKIESDKKIKKQIDANNGYKK